MATLATLATVTMAVAVTGAPRLLVLVPLPCFGQALAKKLGATKLP